MTWLLHTKVLGMAKHDLMDERLTYTIIGALFDVYNYLGFGFLENIYKRLSSAN